MSNDILPRTAVDDDKNRDTSNSCEVMNVWTIPRRGHGGGRKITPPPSDGYVLKECKKCGKLKPIFKFRRFTVKNGDPYVGSKCNICTKLDYLEMKSARRKKKMREQARALRAQYSCSITGRH